MFVNLLKWALSHFRTSPRELDPARPEMRWTLAHFGERGAAKAAAKKPGVVAVYRDAGLDKWAFMLCPCGCGQQHALNLMVSKFPHWFIVRSSTTSFSIFPSVDATTCGAHFVLRNARTRWATYH